MDGGPIKHAAYDVTTRKLKLDSATKEGCGQALERGQRVQLEPVCGEGWEGIRAASPLAGKGQKDSSLGTHA